MSCKTYLVGVVRTHLDTGNVPLGQVDTPVRLILLPLLGGHPEASDAMYLLGRLNIGTPARVLSFEHTSVAKVRLTDQYPAKNESGSSRNLSVPPLQTCAA